LQQYQTTADVRWVVENFWGATAMKCPPIYFDLRPNAWARQSPEQSITHKKTLAVPGWEGVAGVC